MILEEKNIEERFNKFRKRMESDFWKMGVIFFEGELNRYGVVVRGCGCDGVIGWRRFLRFFFIDCLVVLGFFG